MHLKLKAVSKIALTSVCLLGASIALAGGPEVPMHMDSPSVGGFYVRGDFGGFNGTHEYDIHYSSTGTSDRIGLAGGHDESYSQHVINHGLQDSFTLGGAFGYGFAANGRYYFGVEMGARVIPHDAQLTAHLGSGHIANGNGASDVDVKYDSELNYNINFVVTPGIFINDATMAYAVLGGSYGHLETTFDIVPSDGDKKDPYHCKLDGSVWGIVFGAGLRHYVTQHAAVFGEYDYYYYQNEKLNDSDISNAVRNGRSGVGDQGTFTLKSADYKQDVSVHGGAYTVGVMASFF